MQTFFSGPFDNSLFSETEWKNKCALVLVPHQDDEINLAGATIRNLVNHGITVYVVFCITCDLLEPPELRAEEGIRSCRLLGIPDERIIFLGYCNNPRLTSDLAFYNAADNAVITSSRQLTETFSTRDKPEWCWLRHGTHHKITRSSFRDDIADVLLTLKPDLIFAVDFDRHPDHRAVSLLFDEAVGNILKRSDNTYFPEIYKGFAYNGSYLGARDFYSALNLKGEVKAEGDFSNDLAFDTDFPPYNWDERVRIPLPKETLSRTLNGNFLYNAVRAHFSQGMLHNAKRIFNSDQIFWRRRTDAVSYRATITASSGEVKYLNDFKLADSPDILKLPAEFGCGTWTPDAGDPRKEIKVTFDRPQVIQRITLYGNAEESNRVLAGKITLDNGTVLPFGSLKKGAKANHIDLEEPVVISWLAVTLTETEGKNAGLTELQVYSSRTPNTQLQFVKLMIDDTFVYDYWLRNKKDLHIQVYKYDENGAQIWKDTIPDDYTLTCENLKACQLNGLTLKLQDGFNSAVLRIASEKDSAVYDQIVIRKISLLKFLHLKCCQGIDTAMNRLEHVFKNKYYKLFMKEKR